MEITSVIQWMREENIDGEEKEEVGEEGIFEGQSQSKACSEEGSQEVCDKEAGQEDCQEGSQEVCDKETGQEDCQEVHCSSVQGGSEEICHYDELSRCSKIDRSGVREEICEVFRG